MKSKLSIIRQPYEAVMSKVDTNIHQVRILFRIFEKLQDFQRKGVQVDLFNQNYITVELDTNSLLPDTPGSTSHNYTPIRMALKDLVGKVVEIPVKAGENGNKRGEYIAYTGLIGSAEYYSNNRKIRIDIKKELFPYYLELSKGYAKVNLNEIFHSNSVYTIKLYQFISQWRDQKYKIFKLDELTRWLNISPSKKAAMIKRDILDPAMKYMKDNETSIYFTYEDYFGPEGKKNKIQGFKFWIHHRSPLQLAQAAAEFHKAHLTEKDKRILASIQDMLKIHFGFEEMHFSEIAIVLGHPDLFPAIQDKLLTISEIYKSKTSKIENLTAYTIQSINTLYAERQ